ncbi:MAG: XisH family protein [Hormoscilla sp. GM102CHS1]|nr:XisH family protein [Hormoscilla sp. GM102CHS1]
MAKDIYHEIVKTALIKDGWTITSDPLSLAVGERNVYVDLGSEKFFAAEKDQRRIAVEVKSFIRPSPVQDLQNALGQYVLYRGLLEESPDESERTLYLAIRNEIYSDFFPEKIAQIAIRKNQLKLIVFDAKREEIVQWIE